MMVRIKVVAPLSLAALLATTPAFAQTEEPTPSQDVEPQSADDVRVRGNFYRGERWSLDLGGYIRAGFTHIENDPNVELFGRNDGFVLHDARLITHGAMDNGLGFVFSLDAGSRLVHTTRDSPVEELAARMADTYLYYAPASFFEAHIGQFKAPFDAEDLISSANLLFVHRSVANRGVRGVEGFNVEGLSQNRQLGLRLQGRYFPLAGDDLSEGPGVSYALAVANGNGPNQSLNVNDRLAYYGRLNLHWGNLVQLGGGAFHNDSTFGEYPNRVDRLRWGWTADLSARAYGVTLFANIVNGRTQTPDLPANAEVAAMGYQVQIAYEEPFFGLQPAYRFAYFDPSSEFESDGEDLIFDNDALTQHTIGLNYNANNYPVRVMANYTIALEESAVELDNNRLDLLLQLQW